MSYQYLIGECINSFGRQLPTGLDILKLFCYEWKSNKNDAEKITRVVNALMHIWNEAGIPIRTTASIRLKVKNLIKTFKSLLCSRRRSTVLQVSRENDFLIKTSKLFDIVNQSAEKKLCENKKIFLKDQRSDRIQNVSDINLNEFDSGSIYDYHTDDTMESTSSDTEISCDSEDSDDDYSPSSCEEELAPKKRLKQTTIDKMDRAGLSFRAPLIYSWGNSF